MFLGYGSREDLKKRRRMRRGQIVYHSVRASPRLGQDEENMQAIPERAVV
jgi:hypothetical protein